MDPDIRPGSNAPDCAVCGAPIPMVAPGWNGGEAAFGMTTAAPGCADDQHAASRASIDHPPIDALNHVAFEPFCHVRSFSRSQVTTSQRRFTHHNDVICPERCHASVIPDLDRQEAFSPGRPLVVLECSWRAGTLRIPSRSGRTDVAPARSNVTCHGSESSLPSDALAPWLSMQIGNER